jgi:hypothetical protein
MGYHHPLQEPAKVCDLIFDGVIDGNDFDRFVALLDQWLGKICSPSNNWCDKADFNFDGQIDDLDAQLIADFNGVRDVTAPRSNPPTWLDLPTIENGTINMSANVATDLWGWDVEYYFDCVAGNGHDSGWQANNYYVDYVTDTDATIIYRFKVREARPNGNETRWSVSHVTRQVGIPPTGALNLVATEILTASVTVQGNELDDPTGVQYRFQMENGELTGWMSFPLVVDANIPDDPNQSPIPSYRFTGLTRNTDYRVRYQARAAGDTDLTTGWSEWLTVHTANVGDFLPPTPNPMTWALVDPNGFTGAPRAVQLAAGTFGWGATMTASELAVDDSGGVVEFYFECVNDPRFSSGWTTLTTYQVLIGPRPTGYGFRVKARDPEGNETQWSPAAGVPAP